MVFGCIVRVMFHDLSVFVSIKQIIYLLIDVSLSFEAILAPLWDLIFIIVASKIVPESEKTIL